MNSIKRLFIITHESQNEESIEGFNLYDYEEELGSEQPSFTSDLGSGHLQERLNQYEIPVKRY